MDNTTNAVNIYEAANKLQAIAEQARDFEKATRQQRSDADRENFIRHAALEFLKLKAWDPKGDGWAVLKAVRFVELLENRRSLEPSNVEPKDGERTEEEKVKSIPQLCDEMLLTFINGNRKDMAAEIKSMSPLVAAASTAYMMVTADKEISYDLADYLKTISGS